VIAGFKKFRENRESSKIRIKRRILLLDKRPSLNKKIRLKEREI
jgi:hypothetical protein